MSKKVLECGCGVGVYSVELARIADSVYSFDLNPSLVKVASSQVKGPVFFTADIDNPPLKDGLFDAVIIADIIEHLRSPHVVIQRLYDILADQGVLIGTVPSKRWDILYKLLFMKKEDIGHYWLYSKSELKEVFEKGGFRLVQHRMIQTVISAFLDALVARLSMVAFGRDKVLHSEMTLSTSDSTVLSFLYRFLNQALYPLMIFLESIIPERWKVEHLIVFRKG
jgi:SAM-dependent methyltransferase